MSLPQPFSDACLRVEATSRDQAVWIVLHGEADLASRDTLATALANVELDGARQVQLDLSDLDFCDVSTLRRLASFARRERQAGRTVAVRGAQPPLRDAARLLGLHDLVGPD